MHATTPAPMERTLENCDAVIVWFDELSCVVVWRDGPKHLRPLDKGKRIRDLQPGDAVEFKGERRNVHHIEVYR